jgi:predicted ATP-dependent protease
LDRACLDSLAAEELNGRQIKNIVRTAHALAVSSNNQLGHCHINKALNAMKIFEADFAEDAAERAMESEDLKASGDHRAKRRRLD